MGHEEERELYGTLRKEQVKSWNAEPLGLFSDAVRCSDYALTNRRIICKYQIEKDFEDPGPVIF